MPEDGGDVVWLEEVAGVVVVVWLKDVVGLVVGLGLESVVDVVVDSVDGWAERVVAVRLGIVIVMAANRRPDDRFSRFGRGAEAVICVSFARAAYSYNVVCGYTEIGCTNVAAICAGPGEPFGMSAMIAAIAAATAPSDRTARLTVVKTPRARVTGVAGRRRRVSRDGLRACERCAAFCLAVIHHLQTAR